MSTEAIKAALAHIPQDPGVYLMKDAGGRIIYVGKAKRLKARVSSYAREDQAPTYYFHKVRAMVAHVAAVDYVVTANEKEALILESTLIKRHRPRYNVDLKDDKSYPYFRLSVRDDFPRFNLVRRPNPADGAKYFGPFESAGAARQTMHLLQRIFPLRRCSDRAINNRVRPCLDFEMARCPGPCAGKISKEDYAKLVRQIEAFFAGQGEAVAAELEKAMRQAARDEQFELAAMLRDRWQALTKTLERQRVAKAGGEDLDVLGLSEDDQGLRLAVLKVRRGRVVGSAVHDLGQPPEPPEEVMAQALVMLYGPETPAPGLLLVSHMPSDPGLVCEVLAEASGQRLDLRRPQRGDKKGLLDLALMNASRPREAAGPSPGEVLAGLAAKLGLPEAPRRLECMDISHLGGSLTVASLVCFVDGVAFKAAYRRYKIIGAEGAPDDFAAMAEVVARRLGGDLELPDLLVLDGGKGQLSAGLKALEAVEPQRRPPLIALAKGRDGDPDRVFLPGRKNPVAMKPRDPGLLLLMRLRDEAHRFAVTYHRALRKKALTKSILEEVPGVGPGKRRKLFRAFGSLAGLKAAKAEDMAALAGVDLATARRVEALLASLGAHLDTPPPPE
ncbi:MAG: excinuclease ABC subunit UvrC [Desulfarculus sp.]|nr:excinuclease ABC subunit UvrC [Desulfarculus sp.]